MAFSTIHCLPADSQGNNTAYISVKARQFFTISFIGNSIHKYHLVILTTYVVNYAK